MRAVDFRTITTDDDGHGGAVDVEREMVDGHSCAEPDGGIRQPPRHAAITGRSGSVSAVSCTWHEVAAEPQNRQSEDDDGEKSKEKKWLTECADGSGLEHHASADLDEIAEGKEVSDPAHAQGHGGDGEDQAREQHLGQDDHEGELDGLPLVLRDGRDQDSKAKGDKKEEERPEGEDGDAADEGNAEEHDPDTDDHDEVEEVSSTG